MPGWYELSGCRPARGTAAEGGRAGEFHRGGARPEPSSDLERASQSVGRWRQGTCHVLVQPTLRLRNSLERKDGSGTSLAVQRLGLGAFTARTRVQSLVGE